MAEEFCLAEPHDVVDLDVVRGTFQTSLDLHAQAKGTLAVDGHASLRNIDDCGLCFVGVLPSKSQPSGQTNVDSWLGSRNRESRSVHGIFGAGEEDCLSVAGRRRARNFLRRSEEHTS